MDFWVFPILKIYRIHDIGGKYEWLSIPFGIMKASRTLQQFMNVVLNGFPHAYAYPNDVCILSVTWEEHCVLFSEVCTR